MSVGPANALTEPPAGALQIASSAVVIGTARLGEHSLLAQGAIIRSTGDGSVIGAESVVRAGAVVKQRSYFSARTEVDGFPAVDVGRISEPPRTPTWALISVLPRSSFS